VKEFLKSVKIWQSYYCPKFGGFLFRTVYNLVVAYHDINCPHLTFKHFWWCRKK